MRSTTMRAHKYDADAPDLTIKPPSLAISAVRN